MRRFFRLTTKSDKTKFTSGSDEEFKTRWNRAVREQYDNVKNFAYYPVPEEIFEREVRRYNQEEYKSFIMSAAAQTYSSAVIPIRPLFKTGLTIALDDPAWPESPSLILDRVCGFRLEVLDAALRSTEVECLVLADSGVISIPNDWQQDADSNAEIRHYLEEPSYWSADVVRAASLLMSRIETAPADFIAFKEALGWIRRLGLFHYDSQDDVAVRVVTPTLLDAFPSLRDREHELLACADFWHRSRKMSVEPS